MPVEPTVLEGPQKWCDLNFDNNLNIDCRFEFGDVKNPHNLVSSKLNEFCKLAQKITLLFIVRAFWQISTLPKNWANALK